MIKFNSKIELGSGYTSKAYLLDGKFIQLVGNREDAYEIYSDLKANADLLEGKITCVDFPHNMTIIDKCEEFPYGSLIYPIVKGKPLKVEKLTSAELDEVAKKIVEFNKQLHSTNIHWDREWSIKHETNKVNRNIHLLESHLSSKEINSLEKYSKVFENYLNSKKSFCITHGDLWAENLIVDEKGKLTGIIDFGNMAYFLPEVDYASMWNMSEEFTDRLIKFSDEDITRNSVDLFILHRELCSFEYVVKCAPQETACQIEKIVEVLRLVENQLHEKGDEKELWKSSLKNKKLRGFNMLCSNCYTIYNDKNITTCPHCHFPLAEDCVIKNVIAKNLFNSKDYEIDFSNDENVSILIAPNGFGKSTIFNFINFVYNPSVELLEKLSSIPFDSFTVNFTNGGFITLEKNKKEVTDEELKKYNFTLYGKLSEQGRQTKVDIYELFVEPVLQDPSLGNIYDIVSSGIKNIFTNEITNFKPLKGLYLNLKRLEIKKDTKEQLEKKLSNKNNEILTDLVSNLDNLTNISVMNYFVSNILNIEARIKTYIKNEKEMAEILKIYPNNELVKNTYIKTVEFLKKHKQEIDELKARKKQLDLFCKIYNERNNQSGKKISYNNKGFIIKSGQNIIPIENLSDGEKNDFCIFYHLIFNTENLNRVSTLNLNHYSLVIIDEPEVSFHIEWQQTWLDYVLQICKTKKIQVIISTHSPYIVNANFDLYAKKKVSDHGKTSK